MKTSIRLTALMFFIAAIASTGCADKKLQPATQPADGEASGPHVTATSDPRPEVMPDSKIFELKEDYARTVARVSELKAAKADPGELAVAEALVRAAAGKVEAAHVVRQVDDVLLRENQGFEKLVKEYNEAADALGILEAEKVQGHEDVRAATLVRKRKESLEKQSQEQSLLLRGGFEIVRTALEQCYMSYPSNNTGILEMRPALPIGGMNVFPDCLFMPGTPGDLSTVQGISLDDQSQAWVLLAKNSVEWAKGHLEQKKVDQSVVNFAQRMLKTQQTALDKLQGGPARTNPD